MYGLDLYHVKFQPVLCVALCLSSRRVSVGLVSSFRYNGLATLALAAFGRVQALRARCGRFAPAWQVPRDVRGCQNY